MRLVVQGSSAEAADRAAAAQYLASMAADLALIARRHGFDTLGYILEMARLEAEHESDPSHSKS